MKKLSLKFVIICAIIIYIIALVAFHLDYEYLKYGLYEESSIITVSTVVYLFVISAFIGIVEYAQKQKSTDGETENTIEIENAVSLEPVKEKMQTQTDVKSESEPLISNDEDSRYTGTGIIGLKNYTDFCQIIGILAVLSGVLYIIYAIACSGYSSIFIILAIYLITGGIGCFILSVLLKAITTITKAAKLYIDINEKEEEKEEEK